ncbi:MAG: PQQ-dependent sugar dehydrogenase [Chthoniobacteraceae bacterium]
MHWIKIHVFRPLCAALLLVGAGPARAELVHRWSFDEPAGAVAAGTTFSDSISGAPATVVGINASASGAALTLPGSTSAATTPANSIPAYLDLPNGIISSKTNLTVEIWATPLATRSNQHLFDFGRMNIAGIGPGAAPGEVTNNSTTATGTTTPSDSLSLNISRGNVLNQNRLSGQINGGTAVQLDTTLTTATGTQYQYVVVFADNGAGGGRASWYRDGALIGSIDLAFRLADIEDVNNWLGRSQNSAFFVANVAYDEVRIYDHAFTPVEVASSRLLGPNPALPVAAADAITMRHGQKAGLAVLANDTSEVSARVVQAPLSGTAVAVSNGRILYTHTSGAPATDSFTYCAVNAAGESETTVTITFAASLRLPGPWTDVPANPPPTTYQQVDAFSPNITFTDPTCLATPPGETDRLFVCQKGGLLRVVPSISATPPTASTFMNLSALLASRGEAISTTSEQGLLGLAFHPNYAVNGFFYLFYSVTVGSSVYERVSRFNADATDPNLADTTSELVLIEQRDDAGNHNGGDLHFGPDGYLYVSLGDEGNQNDSLNNSQRITKDFLSAILRIDVDKRPGNLEPNANPNPAIYPTNPPPDAVKRDAGIARYSIPADNPFVPPTPGNPPGPWNGNFNGTAIPTADLPYVRSEFWAVGFRNPWRMSFDPATGELWVGDVGGDAREEVDVVTAGKNYGWAYREGFINGPKSASAPANFDAVYHTRPVYEYHHTVATGDPNFEGDSVTGGVVYRGSRLSNLVGAYIFADHVSGNVWSLRRNGAAAPTVERIFGSGGISAFGRDPSNGDVLIANLSTDRVRRLVGSAAPTAFPQTLGATGLFADLTDLAPNPGLVPYTVNLQFWSDHALKRRWFTLPVGLPGMTWSRDGLWDFSAGQFWVKHFDLELERGNPATAKRIETRLLVRNAAGVYGVSYRWDDAGTDATLVADEGVEFPLNVSVAGTPTVQTWRIPSRAQCVSCHTAQGGHALSFTTRQLNRDDNLQGAIGNTLDLLRVHGYFANEPGPPRTLPRHVRADETTYTIEARARSYLAVNCAYCHQAGGTAGVAQWDGRPELSLAQTGLIHGVATNNGGNPANRLIVPGDATGSIVLQRIAAANGFTRMPPLATSENDQAGIDLITNWIGHADLVNRQSYTQWRLAQFGSAISPEGEPGANPDGDAFTNEQEFLLGTLPLSPSATAAPQFAMDAFNVSVTIEIPANRAAQMEAATDLDAWAPWDVPGNDALPRPPGPATFIGPRTGPAQFFRLRVWEN